MTTDNIINLVAAILVGGGTLFLGIMAWRTIRQTRIIQKAEKRERLLNEIIEWALDVAKPTYALNLVHLTSSTINEEDKVSAYELGEASHFDILRIRSDYIAKITLIFTKDLKMAVEKVRDDLEEHNKLIDDLLDGKDISEAIGKHDYEVTQSANKVIEEAVKIKTRDIS